jgi:hypothetical protein
VPAAIAFGVKADRRQRYEPIIELSNRKIDFENYCKNNYLDINEVWYKNENDEMKEFFNIDDCLDIYDFDVDGATFKKKTDLDAFMSSENSSAKIKIYFF